MTRYKKNPTHVRVSMKGFWKSTGNTSWQVMLEIYRGNWKKNYEHFIWFSLYMHVHASHLNVKDIKYISLHRSAFFWTHNNKWPRAFKRIFQVEPKEVKKKKKRERNLTVISVWNACTLQILLCQLCSLKGSDQKCMRLKW